MEVVVALVVVLALAAVAVPSLAGFLEQQNVETAATQLARVRDAIYNTAASSVAFWQRVTKGLSRLSQLSTVIVSGSAALGNSCKLAFAGADVTRWNSFGPFVNFPITTTTGLVTPIGIAVDTITRVPFSATAGRVRINFLNSVELSNAVLLDGVVDASDGSAAGTVQWLPAVGGIVTMYYFVNVNNVC